jgi:hypothetical protein
MQRFQIVVAPRGGSGKRPPHYLSASSFQHPAATSAARDPLTFHASGSNGLKSWSLKAYISAIKTAGAGLTDPKAERPISSAAEDQVTSGLAPNRCIQLTATYESRPIPVRRNLVPWDCKVTPADCTCQEGNTIGCIPNNDGLDARSGPRFPHGRQGGKVWVWSDGPSWSFRRQKPGEEIARTGSGGSWVYLSGRPSSNRGIMGEGWRRASPQHPPRGNRKSARSC